MLIEQGKKYSAIPHPSAQLDFIAEKVDRKKNKVTIKVFAPFEHTSTLDLSEVEANDWISEYKDLTTSQNTLD